jgi:hypothetical protein
MSISYHDFHDLVEDDTRHSESRHSVPDPEDAFTGVAAPEEMQVCTIKDERRPREGSKWHKGSLLSRL